MLIPLDDRASEFGVEVGIIGGSGFYEFLDDAVEVPFETPFGAPSAPVTVGTLDDVSVAFLPRHGRHHDYVAHRVPFRANVWAMASLGVRTVVGPCSCGSLQPEVHPGDFVVVDQLVDRTWGRLSTFYDRGAPEDTPGFDQPLHHQEFADPYDDAVRDALVEGCRTVGVTVHDRGTMVVVNGPRFSTRAESTWFREMGWTVINMTGMPEAVLAAEAGIHYGGVALVTDYDAGVDGQAPVTMDGVLAVMRDNIERLRDVLRVTIPALA
jgi:5'-methylthioadenosine phosphorylase